MSVESLIDTNVFVYQLERLDVRKATTAERLIELGIASGSLYQLLGGAGMSQRGAAQSGNTVEHGRDEKVPAIRVGAVVPGAASLRLYHAALDIQTRYRFSFYDSLIVSAALEAGCTRLYSEDLQHGHQVERLTIENPFLQNDR